MSESITMNSPTERPLKKILVAFWSTHPRRFIGWRFATARKIGRRYVVSQDADDWGSHRRVSPIEALANGCLNYTEYR
jgi:hypothetical protein